MRKLMKRLSKILNLAFLSTGFFLSSCSSQEMNLILFLNLSLNTDQTMGHLLLMSNSRTNPAKGWLN